MKVVVIDDKPLIRRAIVETIDWPAIDCELVASAEDGIAGMEIIKEYNPDIVITDIRMPGMDGLQLAEYAIGRPELCKVIIITGYEDFNYAKECVRLGVFEYILKPIDNDEIVTAVQKAAAALKRERQALTEKEQLIPPAKRQYIADVLTGRTHVIDTLDRYHAHQLNAAHYALMVVRDGVAHDSEGETSVTTVLPEGLNEILEAVKPHEGREVYRVHLRNDIVYVYLFKKTTTKHAITKMFKGMSLLLKQLLSKTDQGRYRYGWSPAVSQLEQLGNQYQSVVRKLRLYFFNQSSDLVSDQDRLSLLQELERFTMMLSTATPVEIDELVTILLNRIAIFSSGNIAVAKILISELCLTIAKYYYKQYNDERVMGKTVDEMLSEVNQVRNMEQAAEYIKTLLVEHQERQQEQPTAYSPMVRNILQYIQENYDQELGLNLVAEHFRISHGHISRLLRKETGSSFVDIVTRTRLDVAKRLMRDPTRRIQEISEMVGFKNYIYFYQVFKKVEKVSPQEYKNNL